jgi:hypothetical protein
VLKASRYYFFCKNKMIDELVCLVIINKCHIPIDLSQNNLMHVRNDRNIISIRMNKFDCCIRYTILYSYNRRVLIFNLFTCNIAQLRRYYIVFIYFLLFVFLFLILLRSFNLTDTYILICVSIVNYDNRKTS